MKIDQVPYGQTEQLCLRWHAANTSLHGSIVPGTEALLLFAERESQAMLRIGGSVFGIEGEGRKNQELLADLCIRHLPRLAWLVDAGQLSLTIQVHTFLKSLSVPPMELGVDEKILEALERIDRKLRSPERALKWLSEQFFLETGDSKFGFVTAASAAGNSAFALFGRTARAFIRKAKRADQSEVLLVDKIVRGRGQEGEQLALLSGDVRFVDATVAGRLRADAAAQLSSLVTSGSSFLDVWNRYGQIENEAALRRARKAGWIKYDHVESLPDSQYRFSLATDCTLNDATQFKQTLSEEQGLSVEALDEIPEVLTREMTWAEYEAQPRTSDAADGYVAPVSFEAGVILQTRERSITLTQRGNEDAAPPEAGFLVVSLQGDKKRLERRSEAERAIREARCPMPQLGLLLEGHDIEPPRYGTIAPMTPTVKQKVFGSRSPTPTQEEAIRVALNTPDIALIQGPPGTGKTTVIVALVERLQEIWDTSGGVQGRLLLSGFQHDAVENAIQRMSVNGLPAIKFGNRPNSGDDDRVDMTISRWSCERSAEIRKNLPPRPVSTLQKEVSGLKQSYFMAPGTLEQTAAMLQGIVKSVQGVVPEALTHRLIALGRELGERADSARGDDPEQERLVRCVRALRCEAAAFSDDGPRNAYKLLQELACTEHLDERARKLLEAAAHWSSHEPLSFLDDLRSLRRTLLLKLLPADRTINEIPRAREDVLELLCEVENHLEQRFSSSRDAVNEATWSFLEALENDPEAVKLAVISYTSVFAATCQQSARKELAQVKGGDGYDTVVVDEAARANPLDLFIPLAKAKRRIVLVGDHRQLPHIIDRELERELEEMLSSSESDVERRTSEMLSESLFERLFNDLKRRHEEKGEVRRTVTLDEQYRMHPLLGQFVSDQFYAKHGEAFRSPSPASDFAHSLPGYSGPAAWLCVPHSLGEEKPGQSKSRPVEARVLVAELKRLMDSPEGRGLTFGVISFYKKQVNAIEEELQHVGMVTRHEDAPAEIVEPYCELQLPNGRVVERLRFGTVDAFQGMEFDVVFLSMVRCNRLPDDTEKSRRSKYGHLMLPNRTCVAMSRQKRLLIAVGDDAMLATPNAKKAVGPLVEFLKLSEVHDAF